MICMIRHPLRRWLMRPQPSRRRHVEVLTEIGPAQGASGMVYGLSA